MEIVRPCPQCQHRSSLQGSSRLAHLRCTVCGFNRAALPVELKPEPPRQVEEERRPR